MKKLLFFFLFPSICSCISNIDDKNNAENVLSFETSKEILKETWLIDAHKRNNQNYSLFPYDSINEITLSILKKHNASQEDLSNTLDFFSRHPKLLDSLLNAIKKDLEETYKMLPHEDETDIKTLNNSEIINILKQCPFYNYNPNDNKIIINKELRDSIFIYFRNNPEKLGHATLKSLSIKLNELIKPEITR